jgi:hypothetical protein
VLVSDDSDYEPDAQKTQQNRNKFSSSEDIDVKARILFIELGNNMFQCKNCTTAIKIVNRSISNLKSHLGRKHKLAEFLTSSQLWQLHSKSQVTPIISNNEKSDLDELALNAIISDSHAFNIFNKQGIRKFISTLKPVYKPLDRKTAAARLKMK